MLKLKTPEQISVKKLCKGKLTMFNGIWITDMSDIQIKDMPDIQAMSSIQIPKGFYEGLFWMPV